MITLVALFAWIRLSLEKLACLGIVFYALRHKDKVAAKIGRGTFEILATGGSSQKELK
jgi:hypothetical protein